MKRLATNLFTLPFLLIPLAGCPDNMGTPIDAGEIDVRTVDVIDPPLPDGDIDAIGPVPDASPIDASEIDGGFADASRPDATPIGTEYTHYVSNTINVPETQSETRAFALNIDGDPNDRPDNALGGIFATLKQQNVDIQSAVTAAVVNGRTVMLHSLRIPELGSPPASWKVLLGLPSATPPHFDGTDSFTVDSTGPDHPGLAGNLTGGVFTGGPGNVSFDLALAAGPPVRFNVVGARIVATPSADGCSEGVLGGALTRDEISNSLIPAFASLFNASIRDDAPDGANLAACRAADDVCPNAQSGEPTSCDVARRVCVTSSSRTILNLFDADKDVQITADEVATSPLVQALFAPDVDLFDATGAFNPRQDGVNDSLSLGIGLTCVKASFPVHGE